MLEKPTRPLYRVTSTNFLLFTCINGAWVVAIIICTVLHKVFASESKIVLAMSLQTHYRQLLTVKRSKKAITCLDGIRTLSILWVVIGHIISQGYSGFSNLSECIAKIEDGWLVGITAGTVAVDTFFLIGGLLTAYLATHSWRIAIKKGPLAVVKTYSLFILNRYMRLTPILAMGIWSSVAFWPIIGNGALYKPANTFAN